MSRTLSNPKLAILLQKKTRQLIAMGFWMPNGFTFSDLYDYADTTRRAMHLYITGRKSCPQLEARVAMVFGISVKELRWRLGLPARGKDFKPVKITRRQNKYGAFISIGARRDASNGKDAPNNQVPQPVRRNDLLGMVPGGIIPDQRVTRLKQQPGLRERGTELLHRSDSAEFITRTEETKMNGYNQLDRSNNMNFLPTLIAALITVESGGNPQAVGDGGRAVGILQIKSICVEDVNRIYGTSYEWPRDAYNPDTSLEIARLYLKHYLKFVTAPAPSDAARIWNGGPHGNTKRATIAYWQKVQPLYAQACTKHYQGRMLAKNGR